MGVQGVCSGGGQHVHRTQSGLPECGALATRCCGKHRVCVRVPLPGACATAGGRQQVDRARHGGITGRCFFFGGQSHRDSAAGERALALVPKMNRGLANDSFFVCMARYVLNVVLCSLQLKLHVRWLYGSSTAVFPHVILFF